MIFSRLIANMELWVMDYSKWMGTRMEIFGEVEKISFKERINKTKLAALISTT